MKRTLILITIISLFLITSCSIFNLLGYETIRGSGDIVTENRNVSNFDSVDVCCGMELYLTQNGAESLQIEADDNILPEIETRVVDQKLEIFYLDTNDVNYQPTQPVRIYLTVNEIQAVSISGGGILDAEDLSSNSIKLALSGGSDADIGRFEAEQIHIDVSGGGNFQSDFIKVDAINLELSGASDAWIEDISTNSLVVNCSGGGKVEISGFAESSAVEMSGGGDFNAKDLQINDLVINISGGGRGTVWVGDRLDVNLSGGSSLNYYGQPEILRQDTTGGSSLDSLGPH